jgi:MoaA/NifB/PqqE/SkfB family radical SAM enzyme
MVTNATLMKGDALLARMARIMGLLTVSIDGATKATYDALRIGADFDEVVGNVRAYNRFRRELPEGKRPPLHFNTILMKRTLAELPDFLKLARDLEAQHVTVAHMVFMPNTDESNRGEMLSGSREWKARTNDVLAKAGDVARSIGLSVNLPPPFSVAADGAAGPKPDPIRCWFLWQRMYVGPFGDVVPCCLSGIHVNGNVRESDFFTQWNSPLYREMRRRVHGPDPYGPCKDCYLVNRSPDAGSFDRSETA